MTNSPFSYWGFSTPEMDECFSAEGVVAAILRFESALALALADVGIAPSEEAEAVAAACQVPVDDAERLLVSTWETGTPLLAIVDLIRSRLATDEERRWVHHGSTTQDAIDTAMMLLAADALGQLSQRLALLGGVMRQLIEKHRDQLHMARTFLQDARPTTFGLRVAGWLDPMLTQLEDLRETRAGLSVQLGGPVGNLAGYGSDGTAVVRAVARRLDLRPPDFPWHTDRSRVRAVVFAVEGPVSTLAKVASDVGLLASSPFAEVTTRAGGSSAMPHKQNPIDAVRALAAADVCHGAAEMVHRGRPQELDRGLGSWHVEWVALPMVFSSSAAVVDAVTTLLETLQVDTRAMAAAVDGDVPVVDPGLIDAVLDHCTRVIGET